jgi:Fe2+ or Zn2+ uptake regulation protein
MQRHPDPNSDTGRLDTHLLLTHIVNTSQRRAIFRALRHPKPLTNQMIFGRVQNASRATVFRTLRLFLQQGIITEVHPGFFELTDRFKQHRHYFWCRICGKVELFDQDAEKAIHKMAASRHLTLEDHHIELTGLCGKCQDISRFKPRRAIGDKLMRPPGF